MYHPLAIMETMVDASVVRGRFDRYDRFFSDER